MNPTTENGSPDWVRSRVVFDISPPPPRRRQSIGGRGLHSADKGGASYPPPGHPPGGTTWSPSTSRPSLPPHPAYPRKEKTVPSSLYRLASGPCHYTHNTINSRFPTVFRFIFIFLTPPPNFFSWIINFTTARWPEKSRISRLICFSSELKLIGFGTDGVLPFGTRYLWGE